MDSTQSISPIKHGKCSDFSVTQTRFPPISVTRYNSDRNPINFKNMGIFSDESPLKTQTKKTGLSVFTEQLNQIINQNIESSLLRLSSMPKTPSIASEVGKCEKEIKSCIFKVNQVLSEHERMLLPRRVNEYGIAGKQVLYLTLRLNSNPNPCILKIRQNERPPDSDFLVYVSYTNRRPDDDNNDGVFSTSKIKIYTRDILNSGENFAAVCRPAGIKPPPTHAYLAVMSMNPCMCSFAYYFENEKPVKFDSEKILVSPRRPQVKIKDLIPLNDSVDSVNKNEFGANLKRKEKNRKIPVKLHRLRDDIKSIKMKMQDSYRNRLYQSINAKDIISIRCSKTIE